MSALAGLVVVDLSRLLPGPYLTRVLCDLGADVIKVEPREGDPTRMVPPFVEGVSAAFIALNHGKRSVVVDLKTPEGVAALRKLVRRADVLVESFRPGVLARLGIAPRSLMADNARLIVCSITGYGQTGPLKDRAGHDLGYLARAGVHATFGPRDAAPGMPGIQIADVAGGAMASAVGVLAALIERQRTGRGRHLDVSMTRGAMSLLLMDLALRESRLHEVRGDGVLSGGAPCYRLYKTRDGRFMALAALEPRFFDEFCAAAGVPHLAGSGLATGKDGAWVMDELEQLFLMHTQSEWSARLAHADCCCEPVRTPEEASRDHEIDARWSVTGHGLRVLVPEVGMALDVGGKRAPGLGEHTVEVLS